MTRSDPKPSSLFRIEVIRMEPDPGPDVENKPYEIVAKNDGDAALAWAHKKGVVWFEALEWNGMSPEDFRCVDINVYPPKYGSEFIVVCRAGKLSVARAP